MLIQAGIMGKRKPKKLVSAPRGWEPKYYKMPKVALLALDQMKKETNKSETSIISNLLTGRGVFTPAVDAYVHEEAEKRRLSWVATIQELLHEAIVLKRFERGRDVDTSS